MRVFFEKNKLSDDESKATFYYLVQVVGVLLIILLIKGV